MILTDILMPHLTHKATPNFYVLVGAFPVANVALRKNI